MSSYNSSSNKTTDLPENDNQTRSIGANNNDLIVNKKNEDEYFKNRAATLQSLNNNYQTNFNSLNDNLTDLNLNNPSYLSSLSSLNGNKPYFTSSSLSSLSSASISNRNMIHSSLNHDENITTNNDFYSSSNMILNPSLSIGIHKPQPQHANHLTVKILVIC